ncbi:MAG: hypothetical protein WAO22_08490 [bacterium]|jgi:hypothetical protein|nr:hypothetical protein [Bacillota bacterium]
MFKIVLTVGFMALFYLSLSRRVEEKQRARKKSRELPIEPRESPFSQATVDLLATAGGVYLALLLIRNFLQITVPEHIVICGLQLEPLAALSLLIAVFQPYLGSVLRRPS